MQSIFQLTFLSSRKQAGLWEHNIVSVCVCLQVLNQSNYFHENRYEYLPLERKPEFFVKLLASNSAFRKSGIQISNRSSAILIDALRSFIQFPQKNYGIQVVP
jgi:hypothetical protein